jgi:hypothetical protein
MPWKEEPPVASAPLVSKSIEPARVPEPSAPQPAASGAQASAARTHTEVDNPAVDGAVRESSETLADVPTPESRDEAEDEAPARNAKVRSRTGARSSAGRRPARARTNRRARNAAMEAEDNTRGSDNVEQERPMAAPASIVPPPASDDVLRRAPPFPSIAAAKRAHDGGKISTAAYEAAVISLKARRTRRIAIEQQNLSQGKISAQEYEWRLGRIDQEYRGE